MKKILQVCLLQFLLTCCKPSASQRQSIHDYILQPYQSICIDSLNRQLIFTNTVAQEALNNKGSLEKEASQIASKLLFALDNSKVQMVADLKIFYLDRYTHDVARGVCFGATTEENAAGL